LSVCLPYFLTTANGAEITAQTATLEALEKYVEMPQTIKNAFQTVVSQSPEAEQWIGKTDEKTFAAATILLPSRQTKGYDRIRLSKMSSAEAKNAAEINWWNINKSHCKSALVIIVSPQISREYLKIRFIER
jgi:flagellar hook assembly protein FlgD